VRRVGRRLKKTPESTSSRQMIDKALHEMKAALGVHRHFSWLGSYCQFANRLATLHLLLKHGVKARLVFVHFCGDRFPDERPCPTRQREWQALIEARRVTLGLPKQHELLERVHEVFLAVPALATASGWNNRSGWNIKCEMKPWMFRVYQVFHSGAVGSVSRSSSPRRLGPIEGSISGILPCKAAEGAR